MKPYIVFTGTHSTGKSTLVNAIKSFVDPDDSYVITGVSRFINKHYKLPVNEKSTIETQYKIEEIYDLLEKFHEDKIRMADRSIIDRYAYSTYNKLPLEDYFKTMIPAKMSLYTHIFYIPPEIKLADDNFRSLDEDYRLAIDNIIKTKLDECNIPYYIVHGSVEERVHQVMDVLDVQKELPII